MSECGTPLERCRRRPTTRLPPLAPRRAPLAVAPRPDQLERDEPNDGLGEGDNAHLPIVVSDLRICGRGSARGRAPGKLPPCVDM